MTTVDTTDITDSTWTPLLPCPFCGSFIDEDDPVFCTLEVNGKDGASLCCEFCEGQGPAAFDEDSARGSWNVRAGAVEHPPHLMAVVDEWQDRLNAMPTGPTAAAIDSLLRDVRRAVLREAPR